MGEMLYSLRQVSSTAVSAFALYYRKIRRQNLRKRAMFVHERND
jgi:hypothetical protein